MKKLLSLLVITFCLVLSPTVLYAGGGNTEKYEITTISKPLNKFYITKGFENTREYTFDSKLVVTGVADVGATIKIEVLKYNAITDKNEQNAVYESVVGKSGIFNFELDLLIGENIIQIEATNKKLQNAINIKVDRLNVEIKEQLENLLLPEVKFFSLIQK